VEIKLGVGCPPALPRGTGFSVCVFRLPRARSSRCRARALGIFNREAIENGGAKRDRTADLLHAMQALSQLSYGPVPMRIGLVTDPKMRALLSKPRLKNN
jgi:hypothetical protein